MLEEHGGAVTTIDRTVIERRRVELQQEAARGRVIMQQLDARRTELAQSLQRIEGAITVIDEILAPPAEPAPKRRRRSAPAPTDPPPKR